MATGCHDGKVQRQTGNSTEQCEGCRVQQPWAKTRSTLRRSAPVTLRDVAIRAGVSTSAVSRAFTPGASVSAGKRAVIMAAAAELGYTPSVLASALTTGRTKMIGLVVEQLPQPGVS
jgi:transcriptional regulator with XRE-family HTH domain